MNNIAGEGAGIGRSGRANPEIFGQGNTRGPGHVQPAGAASRQRSASGPLSGLHPAAARPGHRAAVDVSAAVSQARSGIEQAMQIFHMLNDPHVIRKPSLDASTSWVVSLLENMKQRNFIMQHGREYVDQSKLNKPSTDHIHTPSIAPSGDAVRAARVAQRHFRNERGVVTILGMGENPREHQQRYARYDDADLFVLPEGGPRAAQQFIEVLHYLANGETDEQPDARRSKRLIVTHYGFYEPLLMGLFGRPPAGVSEHEYYRQALETFIGTGPDGAPRASVDLIDRLEEKATSDDGGGVSQNEISIASSAQGEHDEIVIDQLFFASAQLHKMNHWVDAFGNEFDLQSLMETKLAYGEPPEPYHAYEANAGGKSPNLDGDGGKAESFARILKNALADEGSRDALLRRLDQLGFKRGRTLRFFTDDRGIECPDWHLIKQHVPQKLRDKIFAEVKRRVGGQDTRVQAAPGSETTWWANTAGGMSALLEHLNRAYDEYDRTHDVPLERRIRSVCVTTMVELDVGEDASSARNARPVVHSYAGSTMYALREPDLRNPEADPEDSFWWFVPETDVGTDNRSVGERIAAGVTGDYEQDLPWMKAMDAMRASGLRFVNRDPTDRVADYRLMTYGHAEARKAGRQWQKRIRDGADRSQRITVPSTSRDTADARSAGPSAAPAPLFDPHEIEREMAQNDAFVFMSTPVGGDNEALERAKLAYAYFSGKVAVHEHPDLRNLLLVVNGSDPGMAILRRQSAILYRNGLGENPLHLTHVYHDDDQGLALVRQHWQRYRRGPEPPSSRLDTFDVRAALNKGRDEPRRAAAYFCSARSVAIDLAKGAESIGRLLADNKFDMSYGGGSKGMMGLASQSFADRVKSNGGDARLVGISTPMVLNLETDSGELPNYIDVKHIAPDIVVRMKQILAPVDSVIVDRGGDGTFQEAAIAIAMKAAGDPLMRDKPIIFINTPMERGIDRQGNQRLVRLFDPFIEFFGTLESPHALEEGRAVLESLGVRVVDHDLEDELAAALRI